MHYEQTKYLPMQFLNLDTLCANSLLLLLFSTFSQDLQCVDILYLYTFKYIQAKPLRIRAILAGE